MFICYPLISLTPIFSVFYQQYLQTNLRQVGERKETVMFWSCIWPDGCNWSSLVWSYGTFALSPPAVSYIGYFSGLNMAVFTAGHVLCMVQPSYQLWKVSVSLCRRSKKKCLRYIELNGKFKISPWALERKSIFFTIWKHRLFNSVYQGWYWAWILC